MATALAVTPQPATASVLLEVTGAPTPTTIYSQNFTSGFDSWVEGNANTIVGFGFSGGHSAGGYIQFAGTTGPCLGIRPTTGLTVGHRYRIKAWTSSLDTARSRLGVSGIGATAWLYGSSPTDWQPRTYDFTATATSHTITLEADQGPANPNGAVVNLDDVELIDITGIDGPTTILRVDANGSRPVRLLTGQEPIAGVMTVTDYEPALVGNVRYDLTDSAGTVVSHTTTLEGLVELPWLHVPVLPAYRQALDLVTGYGATRQSTNVVHEVIDSTYPAVTLGVPRARNGSLTIFAPDYETALAVEAVVATLGEVVMFRQPTFPGMDMYLTPGDTRVDPDEDRWRVTVDYVEVNYPAGALLGAAGWSFAQAQALASSFTDMTAMWPTFADLAVGPP